MNELTSIHAYVDKVAFALAGRVARIQDALGSLRYDTALRFELTEGAPGAARRGGLERRLAELSQLLPGSPCFYYEDATLSSDTDGHRTLGLVSPSRDPERAIRWTSPFLDVRGPHLAFSAVIPCYEGDRFVGAWCVDLSLEAMHRDLIEERLAPEQQNFIVDRDGFIIEHELAPPELDPAHGALRKTVAALGTAYAGLDLAELQRRGAGDLEIVEPGGEERIGAFRVVPELGWIVLSTFPRRYTFEGIRHQVVAALEHLRTGDVSYRIEIETSEELREIVDAYNQLADAIESDLQVRDRVEATLREATREAEASNEAKDRFIAALSHELRTPLSPVLAAVSSMERDPRTPEHLRSLLAIVHRNVVLEAQLVDDLLDVHALRRGVVRMVRSHIDAHEVIAQAVEICRAELDRAQIHLRIDLGAAHRFVDADPMRLQQVIWNLIRNAIQAAPSEGRIAIVSSNPAPGRFRVAVQDNGRGIATADLTRIFQPFERVQGAGSRRRGLGLGLTIAREIVQAHDGEISVESDGLGRGARFLLELANVADATPISQTVSRKTAERAPSHLRVLVVEDNFDTLEMLQLGLSTLGVSVCPASSAAQALEAAKHEHFDLVVSDVGLPDQSGHDLMRELGRLYAITGIALSGYGRAEDIQRSRAAGFKHHVTKPVDIDTLERVIREAAAQMSSATST